LASSPDCSARKQSTYASIKRGSYRVNTRIGGTLHKESAAEKRQWLLANGEFIMFHSIGADKKSRTMEKKENGKACI
jgi:hypothetical protein